MHRRRVRDEGNDVMATVQEALDAMDEQLYGFASTKKGLKSDRVLKSERTLLVKQLLKFLENVDEDMTVLEVRQELEMELPSMTQKIRQVVGREPLREGEYPTQFWMGYGNPVVRNIEQVHENCGTYGIEWFVAYDAEGDLIGKMNAAAVESVFYYPKEG